MASTGKAKRAKSAPCPQCGKAVPPRQPGDAYPFCSERCQLLDLGKWLEGDYSIPGPPSDDLFAEDDDES